MTSNDAQIDVLLRRYAGQSQSQPVKEHLDADELNAFAEGSLSAAARSRYVSHLVDCDNCRQIVSQLAISSGALARTEGETTTDAQGYSWWKRFSGFFSPLTLTYAAFAAVLILIMGVGFFVMRQRPAPTLVAKNDQSQPATDSAVRPPGDAAQQNSSAPQSERIENKQGSATATSQASPGQDEIAKLEKPADKPAAISKSAKEAEAPSKPLPVVAKKADTGAEQVEPSYATPPLEGQRAETLSREQQSPKGLGSASGPRKAPPADTFKMADRARTGESEKDNRGADSSQLAANQPSASRRSSDEKAKGPRRDAENNARNRNSNEVLNDATRIQGVVAPNRAASEEKPPETRSAGGRKFRRQGNVWVDVKFKSSMNPKSISRGSGEFNDLDSGLRSIAQELSGELIVVWKGKAYRIR
jgi:hypothetical protein